VSPVKYEQGFYIAEDIFHSHRRENFKTYKVISVICVRVTVNFWPGHCDISGLCLAGPGPLSSSLLSRQANVIINNSRILPLVLYWR
jgi:hypothetical protein